MTANEMARAIVVEVATRLYGAEDPALEDLARKVEAKLPDDIDPKAACSMAVTALMQMLEFPAPGVEEQEVDQRWFDM